MSKPQRRVYTTMRPTEPISVSEPEYTDLLRQGLIYREAPEAGAPALPQVAPVPRKKSAGAAGDVKEK